MYVSQPPRLLPKAKKLNLKIFEFYCSNFSVDKERKGEKEKEGRKRKSIITKRIADSFNFLTWYHLFISCNTWATLILCIRSPLLGIQSRCQVISDWLCSVRIWCALSLSQLFAALMSLQSIRQLVSLKKINKRTEQQTVKIAHSITYFIQENKKNTMCWLCVWWSRKEDVRLCELNIEIEWERVKIIISYHRQLERRFPR